MPNTAQKLIKNPASKSENGENAIISEKANDKLFRRSDLCPFIAVTKTTLLIITALITEAENPAKTEYKIVTKTTIGTLIFGDTFFFHSIKAADKKPMCSPETAKTCPSPDALK